MVWALSGLARICQTQGHFQVATGLLGAVEALLRAMQARLDEPERSDQGQAVALLRIQIDEVGFNTAWKAGHSLTLEQAIPWHVKMN